MCIMPSEQKGKTAIDLAREMGDDKIVNMILKVSLGAKRMLFIIKCLYIFVVMLM